MNDLKQSVIASIERTIRESQSAEWATAAAQQGTTAEALAAGLIFHQLMEKPIAPAAKPPAGNCAKVCHQLYAVLQVWRSGDFTHRADIWQVTEAAEQAYRSLFPEAGE